MPRAALLRPGAGAKASVLARMLHPSALTREKWPNTWQKERAEGLVLLCNEHRVVRQLSPATDVYIMTHSDFPNKELYTKQRMARLI